MPKHRNVALFVPHLGCGHRCVFCDQRAISGTAAAPTPDDVRSAAELALSGGETGGEIAFFGGSFTAIDRDYMLSLLEAAEPFVKDGSFSGIRCSTRPDAIDRERLSILKAYGVTAIELGAQSADDGILEKNGRGHTFADTETAAGLIREYGIGMDLQMMTGLYGDTDEGALASAEKFIALRPDTMRIYPTVVLKNTRLARLYEAGEYVPQSLDEAVGLCAKLLTRFYDASIPVIRLGLHSGGGVEENRVAGPYHPAFREICESRIYYDLALERLAGKPRGTYLLTVAPTEISKAAGHKKVNIASLAEYGWNCAVRADERAGIYTIGVSPVNIAQSTDG
ncbi:MAG: radical SAM protein [Clostridia bacterium]|nr:radical SAM protein [Clostridia bacterium]